MSRASLRPPMIEERYVEIAHDYASENGVVPRA